MFERWQPRRDADGGSAGGSSDERSEDKAERASRLVDKHGGDALRLALMIVERETENARYREQLRELKGKVPGDDAVILTGADAARWQQYTALGQPDELEAIKGERDTLATQVREASRAAAITQAAAAEGLHADKLAKLLPRLLSADAQIETRETEQDGQKIRQSYVKQGDTETRLIELDGVADVIDALRVEPPGTPMVPMVSGSKGAATDLVDRFIEQRDTAARTRSNPLLPTQGP